MLATGSLVVTSLVYPSTPARASDVPTTADVTELDRTRDALGI